MFGVFSVSTVVMVGGYAYVAVAAIKAARKGGSDWSKAVVKGLTWPATIWTMINDKYGM